MSSDRRQRAPSTADQTVVWVLVIAGIVLVGAFTLAVHAAAALEEGGPELSWHPVTLVSGLARGRTPWPEYATISLIVAGVLVAGLGVLVSVVVGRVRRRRSSVDAAARYMGRGRQMEHVGRRGATATAARLGVSDSPGLRLGRTVVDRTDVYQGWEDVSVAIAGPRTGKTTALVVPAIMQAPGAVVTTSNKRDVVDATRLIRQDAGDVWVFDPQGIVDEPATWWWNPLSYVTDEVRAMNLADVFSAASSGPNARTDAFFDPKGTKLVASLLLAAAAARRSIDQVYRWVTDPTDEEPVGLLSEHGFDLLAEGVQGEINSPEKQRGGVYGTAERILAFLTNRETLRWVTPGASKREFVAEDFVLGTGTLYSLSKEGRGSASALVAGLTMAVTEAAELAASRSPGGRLERPMVVVLDEAANVCKWPELPNLYSHYGSRGIVVMTILQSWSQGVHTWSREGMQKLWSASTVRLYGGGVGEVEFLQDLSAVIGDFTRDAVSVSRGRDRSVTASTQRDRVLEVSELAGLPRGRAVLVASGVPATLIELIPWMQLPEADRIRQSFQQHTETGR